MFQLSNGVCSFSEASPGQKIFACTVICPTRIWSFKKHIRANIFWLPEAPENLQTTLESWNTENSKNVFNFAVIPTVQKSLQCKANPNYVFKIIAMKCQKCKGQNRSNPDRSWEYGIDSLVIVAKFSPFNVPFVAWSWKLKDIRPLCYGYPSMVQFSTSPTRTRMNFCPHWWVNLNK